MPSLPLMPEPSELTLDELTELATKTLTDYMKADGDLATALVRRFARLTAVMRGRFLRDGRPDWQGGSRAYRMHVAGIWDAVGVPKPERPKVQALVRYHTARILPEVAPADELGDRDVDPERTRQLKARLGTVASGQSADLEPGDALQGALHLLRAVQSSPGANGAPLLKDLRRELSRLSKMT